MSSKKLPQKPGNDIPLFGKRLLQKKVAELLHRPDDLRPVLLFLAGPNGSGKTSFFNTLDEVPGRQFVFVNADIIAQVLKGIPSPDKLAQQFADLMRKHMVSERATFATETVFSDEKGAKIQFLRDAEAAGFHVILVYVTLPNWAFSKMRVEYRVQAGMGHDVPQDKLQRRFTASMENARRAANFVEDAIFLDNSSADLSKALTPMAMTHRGKVVYRAEQVPDYVERLLPMAEEGARTVVTKTTVLVPHKKA